MNLEITGRSIEITPPIRKFVNEQLEKAQKFLPNIDDVQITLTTQKYRQVAELVIQAGQEKFNGAEETNDMYAAINLVFDKIIKQARRRRKKIIGLHRKEKKFFSNITGTARRRNNNPSLSPEIITYDGYSLKPMDVEEASMQLEMSNDIFVVFRNAKTEKINVIYKRTDGNHGIIEPER